MKVAIAVFAKTPGLSPIKTRLAADLGCSLTEDFYKHSVACIEEILDEVRMKLTKSNLAKVNSTNLDLLKEYNSEISVEIFWATAEENGAENEFWNERNAIWTGNGSFGMRLFQVSERLFKTYDKVIFIGTDSPQIDPDALVEVCMSFSERKEDCIVGPCPDGGFYLFGSKQPLPENIWTSVTYSCEDTLSQLLIQMAEEEISYSILSIIGDVDTMSDIFALKKQLIEEEMRLLPKQRLLLSWLKFALND